MLATFRTGLTGARGAIIAAVLSGLLAAPIGCSSSDTPPPAQPTSASAPQAGAPQAAAGAPESARLTKDQLEALVAPIAL